MSSFLLIDAQNRLAIPQWRYVTDEGTLANVEEFLCKEAGVNSLAEISDLSPEAQAWAKPMLDALATLRTLPKVKDSQLADEEYCIRFKKSNPLWKNGVYGVVSLSPFSQEERVSSVDISEHTMRQSWIHAEKAKKAIQVINKFLDAKKDDGNFECFVAPLSRVINIKKQVDAGQITVKDKSVESGFMDLNCCAVYLTYKEKGKHVEGFLDARDGVSPLHRARLFDNEKSVEAFLKRSSVGKRYPSYQVVHVNLGMDRLGTHFENPNTFYFKPSDTDDNKLKHAIAINENLKIRQALRSASRENLLDALDALEQKPEDELPGAPSQKRRM